MIIDNNQYQSEQEATKRFNMLVGQGLGKFIRKPIKNKRGQAWIRHNKILGKK